MLSASIVAPVALLCVWAGGAAYVGLLLLGCGCVLWEWGAMCRWCPVPLVLGAAYVVAAVWSLWVWRLLGDARFVFFLLAIVWGSDIGAYVVGRLAGGPKLAPRISPGKTWSGAVGGLAAAVLAGSVVAGRASLFILACAAVLGIASQLGDLGESALKRYYGVKDSGRMLPGHGGLLDRLDGLLAAAIVAGAYVVATLALRSSAPMP